MIYTSLKQQENEQRARTQRKIGSQSSHEKFSDASAVDLINVRRT